jgi:hypothetical protein
LRDFRYSFTKKAALRELERLYASRWGHFLLDDDAGRDDFKIVAHHELLSPCAVPTAWGGVHFRD